MVRKEKTSSIVVKRPFFRPQSNLEDSAATEIINGNGEAKPQCTMNHLIEIMPARNFRFG